MGDPLTNHTCLLLLLLPSFWTGCKSSVSWFPALPFAQCAFCGCLRAFPAFPHSVRPACLPVSPLGKVSLLFLAPSFFLGWALLPCPLSGSSCLTAHGLAWSTCGAHGCFFTCLLAMVPEILAHCHLLQSRKETASAVGPSPVFGCSSVFGAVLDFLFFYLHFL